MTGDARDLVPSGGELVLYQTEDGRTRIQCRFEDETLWLTQEATIRHYRIVRMEGARQIARNIEHYNLAAILAVGFRVRSHRARYLRDQRGLPARHKDSPRTTSARASCRYRPAPCRNRQTPRRPRYDDLQRLL